MTHLLLAVIYLSFISLGLPDSLLGAAWPVMHTGMNVPMSWEGVISGIISLGTVASSLQSDRLTRKLGTGRVTAISVGITAAALMGFSFSGSFWTLCLWAVPYGLGAGSVDAALNNYVALHYASRHMSWLHCMWGLGAAVGPYIMGLALSVGAGWHMGYRYVGVLQLLLTAALVMSLSLWRVHGGQNGDAQRQSENAGPLTLAQVIRIPGAKAVMLTFFCYCALEQTAILWASSYLNLHKGIPAETAAGYAGLFFIGITAGRALSGFLTVKLSDRQMIRLGQAVIAAGIAVLLIPDCEFAALTGLALVGLGCAPIYPCAIHSTPSYFGAERSQAVIGVQMASAYVGTCLMPPLFGFISTRVSISLMPGYLLLILAVMVSAHEVLLRRCGRR